MQTPFSMWEYQVFAKHQKPHKYGIFCCQNKFDNDKYQFLVLLDEAISLDEIVPVSFISHFHARTGRPRKH